MPTPPKTVLISKKEIGQRLRAVRLERDISQADLAATLGVTQPNVSAVELGRRGLTIQHLVKLCRVLHVSPDDILGEGKTIKEAPRRSKLVDRLRLAEKLPVADQRALLGHLEALLKSHGITGANGSH